MIYLIEGNKESIKHIDFFEEILPKILIVSNSNRTINLFDYENGEYIDSLRQIIDKSYHIPIIINIFKITHLWKK